MDGIINIRQALGSEVKSYISWGLEEGWNMPSDPPLYYNMYPEGWMVAEVKNEVVGKLYSTKYPSGVGHIGYIIVKPEWRGKGIGTALIRHCLDTYLSECPNGVGLYSSEEEIPFYEKLGFQVKGKGCRMIKKGSNNEECKTSKTHSHYLPALCDNEGIKGDVVGVMDPSLSGAFRPLFWNAHQSFTVMSSSGTLLGIGIVKQLARTFRIGPIYAKEKEVAKAIMKRFLDFDVPSDMDVTVDVFCDNSDAMSVVEDLGFTKACDAHLLVRLGSVGSHPCTQRQNIREIYAIASLDFN